MIVGYAPGVYDLFHVGHLRLLTRARRHCEHLVVGAVGDLVAARMKGRVPVVPLEERMEILRGLRVVDAVIEDPSEDKTRAWHTVHFDVLFKGDDWAGTPRGDQLEAAMAQLGVRVVYLPYTHTVSSTELIETAARRHDAPLGAAQRTWTVA
jgi:glycerol-3-phosphate cytidylyltransferase